MARGEVLDGRFRDEADTQRLYGRFISANYEHARLLNPSAHSAERTVALGWIAATDLAMRHRFLRRDQVAEAREPIMQRLQPYIRQAGAAVERGNPDFMQLRLFLDALNQNYFWTSFGYAPKVRVSNEPRVRGVVEHFIQRTPTLQESFTPVTFLQPPVHGGGEKMMINSQKVTLQRALPRRETYLVELIAEAELYALRPTYPFKAMEILSARRLLAAARQAKVSESLQGMGLVPRTKDQIREARWTMVEAHHASVRNALAHLGLWALKHLPDPGRKE